MSTRHRLRFGFTLALTLAAPAGCSAPAPSDHVAIARAAIDGDEKPVQKDPPRDVGGASGPGPDLPRGGPATTLSKISQADLDTAMTALRKDALVRNQALYDRMKATFAASKPFEWPGRAQVGIGWVGMSQTLADPSVVGVPIPDATKGEFKPVLLLGDGFEGGIVSGDRVSTQIPQFELYSKILPSGLPDPDYLHPEQLRDLFPDRNPIDMQRGAGEHVNARQLQVCVEYNTLKSGAPYLKSFVSDIAPLDTGGVAQAQVVIFNPSVPGERVTGVVKFGKEPWLTPGVGDKSLLVSPAKANTFNPKQALNGLRPQYPARSERALYLEPKEDVAKGRILPRYLPDVRMWDFDAKFEGKHPWLKAGKSIAVFPPSAAGIGIMNTFRVEIESQLLRDNPFGPGEDGKPGGAWWNRTNADRLKYRAQITLIGTKAMVQGLKDQNRFPRFNFVFDELLSEGAGGWGRAGDPALPAGDRIDPRRIYLDPQDVSGEPVVEMREHSFKGNPDDKSTWTPRKFDHVIGAIGQSGTLLDIVPGLGSTPSSTLVVVKDSGGRLLYYNYKDKIPVLMNPLGGPIEVPLFADARGAATAFLGWDSTTAAKKQPLLMLTEAARESAKVRPPLRIIKLP